MTLRILLLALVLALPLVAAGPALASGSDCVYYNGGEVSITLSDCLGPIGDLVGLGGGCSVGASSLDCFGMVP